MIEEERTLQKRINEAALQQTRVNGTGKTQTNQNNIGQLTAELELLRGRIRKSSPAYASLTEPASLNLSEIQTKVLEPGTTLLEISLSDAATSYAWEVTSETLRGVKLPSRTDIEAAARRLRKSISAGETPKNESPSQRAARLRVANDFTDANSALSRMVLGPLGGVRAGHRLLIVTRRHSRCGAVHFTPGSEDRPSVDCVLRDREDTFRIGSGSLARRRRRTKHESAKYRDSGGSGI